MIGSNRPYNPTGGGMGNRSVQSGIAGSFQTISDVNMRSRVRGMSNARMKGSSESARRAANNRRLSQHIAESTVIRPLVRKRNAKEYSRA